MPKRFTKVVDGLFRGGEPSIEDLINLQKHFDINKIISLDGEIGDKIHSAIIGLGMKHIIIPINGVDVEPIVTLVSQDLKKLLLDDGPTYVHCRQGKDRTGMVIAMFQCRYNKMSFQEAMDQAKSFGFGVGLHPGITQFYQRIVKQYNKLFGEKSEDRNNADIVDNIRPHDDWRGSVLDTADRFSTAPFMDPSQPYPYNNNGYSYDYKNDQQFPTRNNYDLEQISNEPGKGSDMPIVGQFDGAPIPGSGPVEPNGSFTMA